MVPNELAKKASFERPLNDWWTPVYRHTQGEYHYSPCIRVGSHPWLNQVVKVGTKASGTTLWT